MRKFLAISLMMIPLALFALVVGVELTQNKVLLTTTAGQLASADRDEHDYLAIHGGTIALAGPYLPQRVANIDYVPIFAVAADGTASSHPSFIAIIPAGALAELIQPPASTDALRRVDILGMRNGRCGELAKTGLPATPPLPCITHGKHPNDRVSVLIGSAIMLLPFAGLGLWLWRRRGPVAVPHPLPGCLIKLGKAVMVILIFGTVAIAKLGDDVLPPLVKTAPHLGDAAPVATKVMDTLRAYLGSESFAADTVNHGNKLASLKKNLDTLNIQPGDTLEVQLVQLDAGSFYTRDTFGAFRRRSAKALIEHQIRLNGDIVGGQFFATDTADHWPAVAMRQREVGGPVELIAEQTVHTDKGERRLRIAGEIEFIEGDAAAYQRGDKVVFRYTDTALQQIAEKREKIFHTTGRNPRLAFAMSNVLFKAEDDTLVARATGPDRRIFKP
ncbi:MAG TPA: hypothetical protein PK620_07750 [Denitromonas sp.]|uniref:hypothetical protein n=1 Tax=Denitromonas sp. TaxID=2734609 RepID=UPI001DBBBB78|nr:hypothetical protein [Rhodocyclaceae bacterium]MCP5223027.1 hypothetical protein [Zoogloeaceae bacterium]HQU88105.1 hypothetical protein [Denitromonas sp.]HQV14796.1 hypothetical protein [Denitromonas sp.]